jgi:hypothetical protein
MSMTPCNKESSLAPIGASRRATAQPNGAMWFLLFVCPHVTFAIFFDITVLLVVFITTCFKYLSF